MKRIIYLLFTIIIVTMVGCNDLNQSKKDETDYEKLKEQYDQLKATVENQVDSTLYKEYMKTLKVDSVYVSSPIISKNFYEGLIEVSPGVFKKHYSRIIIGVQSEWQPKPFDKKEYDEWLKNKNIANNKN